MENSVTCYHGNKETITFNTVLPRIGVAVLSQALVVEPVDLRNLPRLVVPSQHRHVLRVPRFEAQEQLKRFYTIVAAIYKVTLQKRVWVVCGRDDEEWYESERKR